MATASPVIRLALNQLLIVGLAISMLSDQTQHNGYIGAQEGGGLYLQTPTYTSALNLTKQVI